MSDAARKITVATCSLAGCFGCHMSFLDIDERIVGLVDKVSFDRTPLTDTPTLHACDIGLVEGGLCNDENVHIVRQFRQQCRILVAVGACAINGGVPAMRNRYSLAECLEESYLYGVGVDEPLIPSDPELPLLLNMVHPIQDAVKVDYFLTGCPPPAEAFLELLTALLENRAPQMTYALRHFD